MQCGYRNLARIPYSRASGEPSLTNCPVLLPRINKRQKLWPLDLRRLKTSDLTGALNPRSTDSSGGNVNLLETALLQAETFFEDLRASLNESSPENLLSTLRNHSSGILDGLSRFAGELKTEVEAHTGNLSTVLQTASANINDTLNSLKTPKVQETVSQLQNQFQSGLETLKEESKKVGI
ncbi:unnamed protein product [Timema podura]|uniref:Uncharacterized protein n=1 Tax=Timema podura TaxID=61482 RepID=A0ABN7NHE9_TIMPD|nr:unnamed protein product [Timema podura]